MIPKPEQTARWSSQEAAIKAEINEAKNALDLMRMAYAITSLDALHAELKRPQGLMTAIDIERG
jgi:hypothetical protein